MYLSISITGARGIEKVVLDRQCVSLCLLCCLDLLGYNVLHKSSGCRQDKRQSCPVPLAMQAKATKGASCTTLSVHARNQSVEV